NLIIMIKLLGIAVLPNQSGYGAGFGLGEAKARN
ncbi:hypothetical protein A2U01_0071033, partial [Trifolium medium]|nr:hypothetical protein [Trifolium medium]